MDVDEDDDFYAPEESLPIGTDDQPNSADIPKSTTKPPDQDEEDLEEGEEEGEAGSDGSDSDIDIITERKDGSKPAPPSQSRYNTIQNISQRNIANDATTKAPAAKKDLPATLTSPTSALLPGLSTSKIDVNAKPIYEPAGKPITQVNIDDDLQENEKPWRRPGTDISDYFNYGFDEFTWALYASKQETLRAEYDQEKIAQNNKKMFEDMNLMMAMGGMPGMIPGAAGAAIPGMEGMTAEMQQMMQQMMASGMDPTQMDPGMFAGMQGNQAGTGGAGNQAGQAFGGQGFGQGQNSGYGYGRGRGGRRNNW